jgi:hypothetical protein
MRLTKLAGEGSVIAAPELGSQFAAITVLASDFRFWVQASALLASCQSCSISASEASSAYRSCA